MPRKFSIGLGNVTLDASTSGARQTSIFSGTMRPGVGSDVLVHAGGPREIDPAVTVSSQTSTTSYHPTLFEDFRLTSEAVYNFFVSDEQVAPTQDASASLGSLPRYVVLDWRPVPFRTVDIPVGRKGVRPPDPRTPSLPYALDITHAKQAVANGYISPGVIAALVVSPLPTPDAKRFDEDGFLLDPSKGGADAASHAISGSSFTVRAPGTDIRTRVNFIDPSIAGALDSNRIAVAADHTHLASLGALTKLAPGLEVISEFNQDIPPRNQPPSFPISTDAPTLAYIGYVVERYTLDQSGSMTLSKTVDISDPSVRRYIDRDVTYGGSYVYRIRSVVQWTHPTDVSFQGNLTFDRAPAFDTSAASPLKDATFYGGEWSDWTRARVTDTSPPDPPDEITVLPRSRRGSIRIVWKVPGNPQLDLASFVLLRARVTPAGTTDWERLTEVVPANGSYDDFDVIPYEDGHTGYVYAMYTTSLHGEISKLSEQIEARILRRTAKKEWPLLQVRPRGMDPKVHPTGVPDSNPAPLVARSRVAFYCRGARSDHPLFDRTYVVEVRSLSTGDRAEVALSVDSTDVSLRATTSPKQGIINRR